VSGEREQNEPGRSPRVGEEFVDGMSAGSRAATWSAAVGDDRGDHSDGHDGGERARTSPLMAQKSACGLSESRHPAMSAARWLGAGP